MKTKKTEATAPETAQADNATRRSRGPKVPKAPSALQLHLKAQVAKAASAPILPQQSPAPISPASVSLLTYCRACFEPDLVTELLTRIGAQPTATAAIAGSGFVRLTFPPRAAKRIGPILRESSIFGRQLMLYQAPPPALRARDRLTPRI